MTSANGQLRSLIAPLFSSPVACAACFLVAAGLALGVTVHKGLLILMALGAFGPSVLRQFRLLNDLDGGHVPSVSCYCAPLSAQSCSSTSCPLTQQIRKAFHGKPSFLS